ncbi:hypothetical protein GCM10011363_42090 [Marivita lacus]|uniref:Uncharacterized protein n=1 Tax=Marivita lacus TaxID=1323742 RepID=A0ABQ1L8L5_9RHOB|nr:hypothetical protein [Marivita lacus]GGC20990.1 hypothetical protein GCM10011363_42090 [Marivita lacus]
MADARLFFERFVRPTLAEFAADTADLRKAFMAVQMVDAAISQVFYTCEDSGHDAYHDLFILPKNARPKNADDTAFRELLAEEYEIYRIHRDLAKAIKHGNLTRGKPLVISTDNASVRNLGYGEGGYGTGPYGGGPRADVQLASGEQISIHWVVTEMAERVENLIELMEKKLII